MQIKLSTIEDINNFVSICTKHGNGEIDVKQGRQIIDGRSILGIFSLNLLEPIKVIFNSDSDNDKTVFYNNIEKWKT